MLNNNPNNQSNVNNSSVVLAAQLSEMSSIEIAEVTGKRHKDVMRSIRKMETAWLNVCGRKFALTSRKVEMPNGGFKDEYYYNLTKEESLYIATKFNDEARAKLVRRWTNLETGKEKPY